MPFLRANIDCAIVVTQYDLRGFFHPLGFRLERGESHKNFSYIPGNLVCFAAGLLGESECGPTDDSYVSPDECSFEECLTMCKQLFSDCNPYEREAIQLIAQDIVAQSEERKAKVASGKDEPSSYLFPLKKDNYWGKIVLALTEAFEVHLKKMAA